MKTGIQGNQTQPSDPWTSYPNHFDDGDPITLELQDPRPAFNLYLPSRFSLVPSEFVGSPFKYVTSQDTLAELFDGFSETALCYGRWTGTPN